MRWDKADIPHKGWQYVGMEDLGVFGKMKVSQKVSKMLAPQMA